MIGIREVINKSDEFIHNLGKDRLINVVYDDDVIAVTPAELIIDRIIIKHTLMKIDIPVKINKNHSIVENYVNDMFSGITLNNTLSNIRISVAKQLFMATDGYDVCNDVMISLDKGIMGAINELYVKVSVDAYSDIITLDISDIHEIYKDKDIRKAMDRVLTEHDPDSISNVYKVIDDTIASKLHENNLGLAYLGKAVKDKQVQHIVGARGFVQDLDGKIYKYPIPYGYLEGLKDIVSYLVESKTAAIALYHSTSSITDSEWFARESQTKAQSVNGLIFTDCKTTTNLLEILVTKDGLKDFMGCLYKENLSDRDYKLVEDDRIVGKTIHIRHAGSCNLENHDEICLRCFGLMGMGIKSTTNIGAYCSVSITESKSQSMLGFKHLNNSAVPVTPVIENIAKKYLVYMKNDACVRVKTQAIHARGGTILHIEIPTSSIPILDSVISLDRVDSTYLRLMSTVKGLVFSYIDKNGNVMKSEYGDILKDGSELSFSPEFIKYILGEGGYTVIPNNCIRVSLEGWQKTTSAGVLIPNMVAAGATQALETFKNLIKKGQVGKEETKLLEINSALQRLYSYIGHGDHLSLLAVVLYSTTIDSKNPYKLARADETRVCNTFLKCFEYTSLSATIAYGYLTKYLRKPNVLSPDREDHVLDVLITPEILN